MYARTLRKNSLGIVYYLSYKSILYRVKEDRRQEVTRRAAHKGPAGEAGAARPARRPAAGRSPLACRRHSARAMRARCAH